MGICNVLSWVLFRSFCPRRPVCICMCYLLPRCHMLTCVVFSAMHMCCSTGNLPCVALAVFLPSFCPRHPVCICMCHLLPRCHMLTCAVLSALHMFRSMGHVPCVALCAFAFFLSQASCVCASVLDVFTFVSVPDIYLVCTCMLIYMLCCSLLLSAANYCPLRVGGGTRKSLVASECTLRRLFPLLMSRRAFAGAS